MYVLHIGYEVGAQNSLRPMVSIDLTSSGYRLEKNETDGVVSFKLVVDN